MHCICVVVAVGWLLVERLVLDERFDSSWTGISGALATYNIIHLETLHKWNWNRSNLRDYGVWLAPSCERFYVTKIF